MHRREFMGLTTGALAAASLEGCIRRVARGVVAASNVRESLDAAAFHATRQFADLRFGKIAYVERGSGDVALFLHGFPLNGFHWRGELARLSDHRRCIAPDFMGLGYSQVRAEQDISPQAQADMIVAFLDALSIDTVDLVANDSGGTVAQLLAVQHPLRIRTMLLTNCDVHENSPPVEMRPFIEIARAGRAADEWLAPQLADKSLARSDKGCGRVYTDPANFTDEAIDYYYSPLLSSTLRKAQFNRYTASFYPNPLPAIEPALKRCVIPTRIVWGTDDFLFDVSWAKWLDRTLPRSRGVRYVEGAKLFFPEEMPDLIAEEARRLWRAV
jgi:pimeloyl-ACP methyl ester carboxylesterase